MTSPAVTVGPNDTVEHAAQLMLTRKVKRLPVVDGVVTLEGNPETVAIGHDLVWRARHVEGVVAVRDRLVYPVPPVPVAPGPYF